MPCTVNLFFFYSLTSSNNSLAIFMFIWQIPHFWLLLLMYDDQYKDAGIPTLSAILNNDQIKGITYSWIIILVLSSSLVYFSGLADILVSILLLIMAGEITLYFTLSVTSSNMKKTFKKAFMVINAYVLFVLIIISLERIF